MDEARRDVGATLEALACGAAWQALGKLIRSSGERVAPSENVRESSDLRRAPARGAYGTVMITISGSSVSPTSRSR
jgi:hypothetical protein